MDDGYLFMVGISAIQVGLVLGIFVVLERRTRGVVRWTVAIGSISTVTTAVAWVVTGWTWNTWEYYESGEGEAWQAAVGEALFVGALVLGALTSVVVYLALLLAAVPRLRWLVRRAGTSPRSPGSIA